MFDTVTSTAIALSAILGCAGLGVATFVKLWKWIDRQDARAEAVDTFRADWDARGITAAGAVAEQAATRDQVTVLTAAQAATTKRLDDHEELMVRANGQLSAVAQEVRSLGSKLAAAGVIDRRD